MYSFNDLEIIEDILVSLRENPEEYIDACEGNWVEPCPYDFFLDDEKISYPVYQKLEDKKIDGLNKKVKDREKLVDELYERDYLYHIWTDFLTNLKYEFKDKGNFWETPDSSSRMGSKTIIIDFSSCCADIRNLFEELNITSPYGYPKVEVARYKKGYLINKIPVLPSCEEGYHRDWENDGICVRGDLEEF